MKILTIFQVGKGKSIWSWPSGHATDSEEAIAFADLHGIDCLVKEFPLEQCNEAFGIYLLPLLIGLFSLTCFPIFYRGYDGGKCAVPCCHHHVVRNKKAY